MAKTVKGIKSEIKKLACQFDQAQFDALVDIQESRLRQKASQQKGKSNRLYKLEKQYGSTDIAFNVWAQEKIWFKILLKRTPNRMEDSLKAEAQRIVATANSNRSLQAKRLLSRLDCIETDPPLNPPSTTNWRNWGHH